MAGLLGNTLSLIVLLNRSMRIAATSFLLQSCHHLSTRTLSFLTIQRSISVYVPLKAKIICSCGNFIKVWTANAILLAAFNSMAFVIINFEPVKSYYLSCSYSGKVYVWCSIVDGLLECYVQFTIILIGNILIVIKVKLVERKMRLNKAGYSRDKQRHTLSDRMTAVLIVVTTSYVLLITPIYVWMNLSKYLDHHLSNVAAPLAIGRCQVSPAVLARNIGVIFDETMSMDKQIRQVCKTAFHQLHNIRSIRKFLDRDALQTLVHALVTSKLDYFNSLYGGRPVYQIMKLQRVQNAVRLVLGIQRCEHITPGLKSLHWLPVEKRIVFKLCLLVYKTRHCLAPSYLCGI